LAAPIVVDQKQVINSVSSDTIPKSKSIVKQISKLEIPFSNSTDRVIDHLGYSFLYNEAHEQASWVAYELTKLETDKLYDRTNKFLCDPLVKSETACNADYLRSGFDKGHLAPAADMGWSATAMKESFYFSNMSPQDPSFNRGIWKRLEELVRDWAIQNNSIYIVTGPVLSEGLLTIGANKVSIPKFYYKVILDYTEPEIKSIAFIMPNAGSKDNLQNYAVSIDNVEKATGIDFFPSLPDEQENEIEKELCVACWQW
jgi:endonuclease G, mitochondrial